MVNKEGVAGAKNSRNYVTFSIAGKEPKTYSYPDKQRNEMMNFVCKVIYLDARCGFADFKEIVYDGEELYFDTTSLNDDVYRFYGKISNELVWMEKARIAILS